MVRVLNLFIRLLASLVGGERVYSLMRYFSFVSREANLARILAKRPFEFRHLSHAGRVGGDPAGDK